MSLNNYWFHDCWNTLEWLGYYHDNINKNNNINNIEFLYSFAKMIPCDECSVHFLKYLNINYSIESWSKLVWDFHNDVNKKLNKPLLSWDDYYKKIYIDKSFNIESIQTYLKSFTLDKYIAKKCNFHDRQLFCKWYQNIKEFLDINDLVIETTLIYICKKDYIKCIKQYNDIIINNIIDKVQEQH